MSRTKGRRPVSIEFHAAVEAEGREPTARAVRTDVGVTVKGRSIGSGQVEGACKNMIGKRLKQTGARRWRVRRVNNMGTLCAVLYSDQWEKYWGVAK